jgi:riboflavin kinase, archaea type
MRRITGIVESGRQKAAFFTELPWVQEQCREKLGFFPYPGTLNIRLDSRSLAEWKRIPSTSRPRLIPPEDNVCTAELQPADIQGIPGAVIILPKEYDIHDVRVIEVLAPCNLKKTLNIRDSDPLTLVFTCGPEQKDP